MVPTLIARADGLPVSLLDPVRVWPAPDDRSGRELSARARARIERQTAVVHECRLAESERAVLERMLAEQERWEIRSELAKAGLL
jgi:hypothetical protein